MTRPPRTWEDLRDAPPLRHGPRTIDRRTLAAFVRLTGENHPIHGDPAHARALGQPHPLVPGSLIVAFAAGWAAQAEGAVAVLGLRSMRWDYPRPLHPDRPVWLTTQVDRAAEIDAGRGLIDVTRRLTDAEDRAYAIGRLSLVVLRRSP